MKYVRTFQSFRENKSVNEELLGGVLNFLKGMWGKAMEELDKIGKNPSLDDIKGWIADNPFNPSDNNYIFKTMMEEFKKKPEANDQDCLQLVDNAIDPETGAIGKQGLTPLFDTLKKKYPPKEGEPMSSQFAVFEFILNQVRNKAIVKYKYAGGPTDGKVDPKKKNIDPKDTTHLPDVKKILTAAADGKKKKDAIINFMEKTLFVQLDKFVDEIKEEDVKKYLEQKKVTESGGGDFKEGDSVFYKRDKFDEKEWEKITDEDKKKPMEGKIKELMDKEIVGIKVVDKISGDEVSFKDADFKKKKEDILGKAEGYKVEGQEDLVDTLKDVKGKNPEGIKAIGKIAKLYQEPDKNKDKIEKIEKEIGGEEG
jgi:hypothetical protein